MTSFALLMLREFWEHGTLWKVPLLLVALTALASAAFAGGGGWLQIVPAELSTPLVGGTLRSLGTLLYLAFWLLTVFYLVDSLYAERQDRSVLFWRSLPVSDAQTVLSKFCVGVVLIPCLLWLTVVVAQTLALLLQRLLGGFGAAAGVAGLGGYWLDLIGAIGYATLWSLPLFAWCLFCSSWTRRTPLLAALSIPLGLVLTARLLGLDPGLYRLFSERLPFGRNLAALFGGGMNRGAARWPAYDDAALWGGVGIAAALVVATVWVRRWRDDG